ncbi:hypothetical protein JOQ06_002466 [Pogonophryne albipinna]|uniref:DUF3715 domain-containing protein n=1 Tax=Pogonophryne albipinna TaxID=1090488 RepID=A0AAD6B4G7_9TELE|nr:hypothetical protein JOQ06_002466 [Pogonophryne albipinna]
MESGNGGASSKGVYISMYSDCLDLNRWYHGKSGYIAIIRLTKGRVKNVSENYTQNLTAPTAGFDCHASEQLPSVSAKTSSFLAFERTQYYMYEMLNDESNGTAQSPSAACPFAIVSFSYTDTKATPVASPEKRVERKLVPHYLPWRGQLELGAQLYDVGLRTTAGALIPAELPPVVKIDQAISMSDLRQLLPKAVFETCFSGEVFLDGLYCTLCEFVPCGAVETQSLALLLREVKEKDLALTFQLHDGGFLILLHSSHFLTYDDTGSNGTDVLQGIFVFPVSQIIRRDTKLVQRKPAISTDILQVLPVLSYAECEVEKTPIDPGEELCEVLVQHMQSYAALINPGFASIPSREVSIFPDQYDVPDAHKHFYLSPEWTNRAWQSFRTYLSKPLSFQLPVSKASEIFATGREDRMEYLDDDDDVYIFYSSPEEAPANSVSMESEDQLTGRRSPVNVKNAAAQVDSTDVSQNVLANDLQAADVSQDTGKFDLTVLIKADEMASKSILTPSKSDDLPAELIVSITSAEGTVTDEGLSIIGTVSATNHNDFHLSGFTTDKLQTAGVNSLNDKTVTTKNILDCPEVPNLSKTQRKKLRKCYKKMVQSTMIVNEMNDFRSTHENMTTSTPLQKDGTLEHNVLHIFQGDGTYIPAQEMKLIFFQPENDDNAPRIGHLLFGCKNDKSKMIDGICNSEATGISLIEKHGKDFYKSVRGIEVDLNKKACDVVPEVEHDGIKAIQRKKETPCQESNEEPSPKVIHTNYDSTKNESGIVCNGNLVENEKPLSRKEAVSVSPGKDEIVKEDMDCSTVHKGEVIEDASGKGIGLNQKDSCVSAVVSLKLDCIEECRPKPPLVEQQPETNHENDSALSGENAMSENTEKAQLEIKSISKDLAVEDNSEIDISLADKVHYQMAPSPRSDEKNSIVDGSNADGSIPLTKDQCKNGSNNRVLANLTLSSHNHEDQDTNSIEAEQKVVDATQKELFPHQSQSPRREADVALIKGTDVNQIFKPNEGLEKIDNGIVIPFIGIDTSQEDAEQPHNSISLGNIKEVVKEGVPMICVSTCPETVLPTGVCSTSKINSKKAELYAEKVSGSESDDRCPTPTMDETPYQHPTGSGPGPRSSSVTIFCGSETSKNMTPKCHSRGLTSLQNEMPNRSTVHSDANPHNDLDPDVELRTLRVFKSIHKYFSKSNHVDTSSQIQTADKHSPDKTPNLRSKYIPSGIMPSHISSGFEDKKMSNTTSTMTSASTSQELHKESTAHILIVPFKSKLEEVLGVKLQLQETESSVHQLLEKTDKLQETSIGPDMCHPSRSVPSTESLQDINQNTDQDEHNTTSKTNLSQEPRSYSQRPIMAVKPSKSDESKGDFISKDKQIENTVMSHFSKNAKTKSAEVAINTILTMFLEKKTENLKRTSEGLDYKQGASELPPKRSLLSSVSDSEPKSDKDEFILLDSFGQHQGSDITQFNRIPSPSLSVHSCDSEQNSSGLVDGNQGFMTNVEKIGQATKQSIEMYQKNCSNASTSDADYKQCGIIDDSLSMGPNSSLMCTVHNSSQERSPSFLEQVSQRCIQDDPTEASMEKECLIFSEQMKLLLKRKNREPICQQDTHDKVNLSCVSPMTVHFSSLEEQEDSLDPLAHLDAPSFIGHKIKVDLSERKDLAVSAKEGSTLHPQKLSQETDNPMKHPGISGLKSEYARLYKAMMNEVCDANKVSSRPKHFRMDRGYSKTEPSNHFDFCDQMKREMDESFRSNLNSVVKKSCKTKYRFYIMVTSEDDFFEETKVQLESEGHTAVQPTEFFLGEDCHSSLLIILRNEDIAEHICEVPHLLELRKSPVVQFTGIDEPDDVVNLTHQELFTRGGFIMFDRAGLEHLNLCNIKKTSEVLQELSKTGKWKWMLHYRDSRWLKENARLSLEGKEKQNFVNCCQEAGILEVLPYHECDLMSRDGPDYLACLVRLQVQNISARYPVFITDTTAENAFGKKGILTMTFDSFLMYSPSLTRTA